MKGEGKHPKTRKEIAMSKAELETAIRNDILNAITEMLSKKLDTDVMPVSASELAIPVLDAEGNEKFALVKLSIPRGTRDGNGGYTAYDGYSVAEDYKAELEEKKAKKIASEQRKADKEAERARKREARQVKKAIDNLEKAIDNAVEKGE